MKKIICTLSLALGPWLMAGPADAARCAQGKIYYRSAGACVSKAQASRAGIYRPRAYRAAGGRSEARRARVAARAERRAAARAARAAARAVEKPSRQEVRAVPAFRWSASPPTPMWYVLEPNPWAPVFGRLVMPLHNWDEPLRAWGLANLKTLEEKR